MARKAHQHKQIKHTYILEFVKSSAPTCWWLLRRLLDGKCTVVLLLLKKCISNVFQKMGIFLIGFQTALDYVYLYWNRCIYHKFALGNKQVNLRKRKKNETSTSHDCRCSSPLQTFILLCRTSRWTMGILTVMCYEQAGLFEYFIASGSQAGCSFVKALYCISFLCQSPFPVAVACQTMTLCFLQVAWRQACHEPWGLDANHWTTSEPLRYLPAFKSFPTLPFLDITYS